MCNESDMSCNFCVENLLLNCFLLIFNLVIEKGWFYKYLFFIFVFRSFY